ncbi:TPA: lipase [Yersinia enterocolitica]|nr:lipase [Yersinia enterocolitica]HDL7832468.1 lipase [Yersinia enterocolitica]HDL7874172.1 lipase [Yersinia enterocolitica]HDL7886389.1 lipase [Yersinia enterocolitica]HDL7894826.1 lipase [Yersinia enterocolitica]
MGIDLNHNRPFCHSLKDRNNNSSQDVLDGPASQNLSNKKFCLATKFVAVNNSKVNLHDSTNIKKLYVFGDSLSDSEGRMRKKTLGMLPSASQYYKGRFTNGFTWVDFLSTPKNMIETINKAEGGAVSASYSKLNPVYQFMSNMSKQIKGVHFNDSDLAIVSLGSNDYMTFHKRDVDKVVHSQEKNIKKMIENGVKNILVMGIPDSSITPGMKINDQQYREEISNISKKHNFKLEYIIDRIKIENKDVNVHFFDINKHLKNILSEAKKLGYENELAYHSGYVEFGKKENLNIDHNFSFNDNSHPSQELHAIFAMIITQFITEKFSRPPM